MIPDKVECSHPIQLIGIQIKQNIYVKFIFLM
jgi:hypothetical protein